jgi:hypothetical protein
VSVRVVFGGEAGGVVRMNTDQLSRALDCRDLLVHFRYRIEDLHALVAAPGEGWDVGPAAGEVAASMSAAVAALSDAIGRLDDEGVR